MNVKAKLKKLESGWNWPGGVVTYPENRLWIWTEITIELSDN